MLLTIDVGNTNIVFGLFQGDALVNSFRLMTETSRTSDEMGLAICQYFTRFQMSPEDVEDVILASVVPQLVPTLCSATLKYFGKQPYVVDRDVFPALQYDEDERLGADRAAACDAAVEKYGAPLIVLDFGTATTVDAVGHDGWYRGGCILPGLQTMAQALSQKAAMLPQIELVKPKSILSVTAIGQIQGGIFGGYLGAVEYLVKQTKQEIGCGDSVRVVATGGLASLLSESTDTIDIVDEQLVLDGLRLIYQRRK